MKRTMAGKILLVYTGFLLGLCFKSDAQARITVAVAANMQYTMDALKTEYLKTDSTLR